MLEHLFGSKTRVKLLRTFFLQPEKTYFVRELTRLLDVQINAVRRELELLITMGLIKETEAGPNKKQTTGANLRKYYAIDINNPLYPELHALVTKSQMFGEEKFIDQLKNKAGDLKLLVLTGRFVRDAEAASDILLVGAINTHAVDKVIAEYEKEMQIPVRYTIMSESEFLDRRHVMDKFIFSLFGSNAMKVVNELDI